MESTVIGYIVLAIILVFILLIGIYFWVTYNSLVKLKVRVDEAWSDVLVQLKRRIDLLPNLANAVKGYAKHESEVFESVTRARSQASQVSTPQEASESENIIQSSLKSLFAVAEDYPELRANENFIQLQSEIVDTENKIQASRRFYNGGVRDYNTKILVFPNNIFVKMLKFIEADFFDVDDAPSLQEPPKIQF